MKRRHHFVYIMTNKGNSVLYTGVTSDLSRRVQEHKGSVVRGFTSKYKAFKLVWYEVFDRPDEAVRRERQIKDGSRQRKIDLVNSVNPGWRDLAAELRDRHATLAMTHMGCHTALAMTGDSVIARPPGLFGRPWQSPAGGGAP